MDGENVRQGENIRQRIDGRFEARYCKYRDKNGKIVYGYCYGRTYEEASKKREEKIRDLKGEKKLNLLILGAGNHGQEVAELVNPWRIFEKVCYLDDMNVGSNILGKCENFDEYLNEYPVAIPAIGDNLVRRRWMEELIEVGFIVPTLIHISSNVSPSCNIGIGTVICAGATVGIGAQIGKGCIIDSGAVVEKGAIVDDWTWIDCGQIVKNENNI